MKRYISPYKWSNSKFINPFLLGSFIYNDKIYECKKSKIQMALFLFIFGWNTNKSVANLFSLNIGGIIKPLSWIKLPKLIYRLKSTDGVLVVNYYTEMLDKLYTQSEQRSLILDYEEKELFYTGSLLIWDSWIKEFILKNYPYVFDLLQKTYPDINIFKVF